MKTQHIRKDKNCLNCGTEVPERFCSHCGQENVETKESFGHLISHFFQDITHYDSKFVLTFKYLFTRPGLLTKQYVDGRRMDYVNPIRLYIFTSFVFFLVLGIVNHADEKIDYENSKVDEKLEKTAKRLEKQKATLLDSIAKGAKDSVVMKDRIREINSVDLFLDGSGITSKQAIARYDSLQNTIPVNERDGFLKSAVIQYTMKLKYDGASTQASVSEMMMHNFPKLMFILLPFFALLLRMAYFRRKMFYTEHAIFTIHIHTFIFIATLIVMLVNLLLHYEDIYVWLMLIIYIYFIIALRKFYGGSIGKALLKSIVILMSYFIGAIIIFIFYIIVLAMLVK